MRWAGETSRLAEPAELKIAEMSNEPVAALYRPRRPLVTEVAVQVLGRDRLDGPELGRIVWAQATEATAVALAEAIGPAELPTRRVSHGVS